MIGRLQSVLQPLHSKWVEVPHPKIGAKFLWN